MRLPKNFASLWKDAASEEALQNLVVDLKAYSVDHWHKMPRRVECLLLSLFHESGAASDFWVLTAILELSPLDFRNTELQTRILQHLEDPNPEVRLAAITVVGRFVCESHNGLGAFLAALIRGSLGAFQANTLESTANNLRTTLENTVNAESVIRDTDFAKEIAEFTKNQVLVQAGTSVLGNANQIPQQVLSLL